MIIREIVEKNNKQEIVTKQIQFHNTINKLKSGNTVYGYKLIKWT
jgi:hypothetical protein